VVEAHYLEDADGRGFYVTTGHSPVSDGRYQAYIHPPEPILSWLVPDADSARRWISFKLQDLGHRACGARCHRHEEAAEAPDALTDDSRLRIVQQP
jgi:hypothetical protein